MGDFTDAVVCIVPLFATAPIGAISTIAAGGFHAPRGRSWPSWWRPSARKAALRNRAMIGCVFAPPGGVFGADQRVERLSRWNVGPTLPVRPEIMRPTDVY